MKARRPAVLIILALLHSALPTSAQTQVLQDALPDVGVPVVLSPSGPVYNLSGTWATLPRSDPRSNLNTDNAEVRLTLNLLKPEEISDDFRSICDVARPFPVTSFRLNYVGSLELLRLYPVPIPGTEQDASTIRFGFAPCPPIEISVCGFGGIGNRPLLLEVAPPSGRTRVQVSAQVSERGTLLTEIGGGLLPPPDLLNEIVTSRDLSCRLRGSNQEDAIRPELRPLSLGPFELNAKGSIRGLLKDRTRDDNVITRATILLFQQKGYLRDQNRDESDEEYRTFLRSNRTLFAEIKLDPAKLAEGADASFTDAEGNASFTRAGRFTFSNVPIFVMGRRGGVRAWGRAYYTLEVSQAQTEELLPDESEQTLYFLTKSVPNITVESDTTVFLDPFDGAGAKRNLIEQLSLLSPNHYLEIENLAQLYVNQIVAQIEGGSLDEERLRQLREALKRAIWAERAAFNGVKFADELITFMLDGLATLVSDLVDELKIFDNRNLKRLRQESDALKKRAEDIRRIQEGGGRTSLNPGFRWQYGRGRYTERDLNRIETALSAKKSNSTLGFSEFFKGMKTVVDAVLFKPLKVFLINLGADQGATNFAVTVVEKGFASFFNAMIHQSLQGLGKELGKVLLAELIKSAHDNLLDGQVASYTRLTKDALQFSRRQFEAWATSDPVAYQRDRAQTVATLSEMSEKASDIAVKYHLAKGVALAASTAQGAFDALSLAIPEVKALGAVGKVTKYAANTATFVLPAGYVFLQLPDAVRRGIYQAYGQTPPQFALQVAKGAGGATDAALRQRLDAASTFNPNLLAQLQSARDALHAVLDRIVESLQDDHIPDVVWFTSEPAAEDTLQRALERFAQALSHLKAQALGSDQAAASTLLADAVQTELAARLKAAELQSLLLNLSFKALLLTYPSERDSLYLADRNRALSQVAVLQEKMDQVVARFSEIVNAAGATPLLPAVVVDRFSISSDETGSESISSSPERFTLRAAIRNLGTVAVTGLSARLTISAAEGSVEALTPLELGGATPLAADDGVPGSGGDEVEVAWQVRYREPLASSVRLTLQIEVLENGAPAVTFVAPTFVHVLGVAPEAIDRDVDGLPDDYETANGLDPSRDDADEDPDLDGLSSISEFEIGTKPDLADTDGDGLTDLEEVTGGSDAFITDPLNADTDGDGLPDASDPQPADADPQAIGGGEEARVAVERSEVHLSRKTPSLIMNVTNAGAGTLSWTAESANEALVLVSPRLPEVASSRERKLVLSMAPGYDTTAPGGGAETTVRVSDASGSERDFMDIRVRLESIADIKGNRTDGPLSLGSTDAFVLSIGLDAAGHEGEEADWWVAAATPFGIFWFDGTTFTTTPAAFRQAPITDVDELEIINLPGGLPVGSFTLFFAVDTTQDGIVNEPLYYDDLRLEVIEK
ncbi:MAG: hypothetical protein HYY96_04825 [Candidatus Tectomicrobia bacterium]|nr:hypothetical protein [Candidatus Tectomicrobia bacterium]